MEQEFWFCWFGSLCGCLCLLVRNILFRISWNQSCIANKVRSKNAKGLICNLELDTVIYMIASAVEVSQPQLGKWVNEN